MTCDVEIMISSAILTIISSPSSSSSYIPYHHHIHHHHIPYHHHIHHTIMYTIPSSYIPSSYIPSSYTPYYHHIHHRSMNSPLLEWSGRGGWSRRSSRSPSKMWTVLCGVLRWLYSSLSWALPCWNRCCSMLLPSWSNSINNNIIINNNKRHRQWRRWMMMRWRRIKVWRRDWSRYGLSWERCQMHTIGDANSPPLIWWRPFFAVACSSPMRSIRL